MSRQVFFYKILRTCLQNELIALIGAFGVNFVQFILIRFWLVKFWIPGLDVAVAYNFLEGNKSFVSCLGILAKNYSNGNSSVHSRNSNVCKKGYFKK